ncbi:hypothetical protein [Streptomyces sp. NPDC054865]
MDTVLRIDTDGAAVALPWPDDGERRQAVRAAVGGPSDRGVYHRRAHHHVHGSGQSECPMNLAAWVLACLWRGIDIPYGLYGDVVVTGPDVEALDAEMVGEVLSVCAAVAEVRQEWSSRPPVGEAQARAELLAAGRHALSRCRADAV